MRYYEIRDPVHGFIQINEWERDIINHPYFQRLRRIKQLAWTDMVYPGATHNRFEHSLGVMHVATLIFDAITKKEASLLKNEMNYTEHGLDRDRSLLRIACLLHDVGHSPFSHAGEGLMVDNPQSGKPYKHEHYSAAAVRYLFKDVIEHHPVNQNYHITAEEVAQFIEGSRPKFGRSLLWRDLLSSQLDADRADYLLRDSYHCGVTYGNYDLKRLIVTMTIGINDTGSPLLAIEDGGVHVAEALILARYQMFTQVYFQHTRRAYDHHIADLLRLLLSIQQKEDSQVDEKDKFPPPTSEDNLKKYLNWDDWKVFGMVSEGYSGEVGNIVRLRKHYRKVFQTGEIPSQTELIFTEQIGKELEKAGITGFVDNATSSWYKMGQEDISICEEGKRDVVPLSTISSIVRNISPVMQHRIYVPVENKAESYDIILKMRR